MRLWGGARSPSPGRETSSTWPPARSATPWTVASPNPLPSPVVFVVKKGSNARSATSGDIPVPVSATEMRTYVPGAMPGTA